MLIINRFKAYELIKNTLVLTACFIKKDGTHRTMKCSFKDDKYPGKPIIVVYDLDLQEYRSLNLETLKNITVKGQEYLVQ